MRRGFALALAVGLPALSSPAASAAEWVQTTAADFNEGTASSAAVVGGAVRLHGSPDAWSSQTGPDSLDYYGVHQLSNGEAWGVGKTRLDAESSYNVAVYDGSSWSAQPTMPGGYDLYTVWMTSTIDGWAGGGNGRFIAYDSGAWFREVESNPTVVTYGLHMLNDGQGWGVGTNGAIFLFDGGWNEFPSPTNATLYGVFAVSSSDAWAVGKTGVILRYDGTSWSSVNSPVGDDLWSVQMLSSTDGWIVGANGKIIRYDGTSWSEVGSPASEELRSLSMPSSAEGWAVGYAGKILRYDGSNWAAADSPTGEALTGVSCASPERCLAVGYSGTFLKYSRDYVAVGTFTSVAFDVGSSPNWGTLSWTASAPSGTQLRFQLAASNDIDNVTDFRGPDGASDTYYTVPGTAIWSGHAGRYLKYRAVLSTDGPLKTPYLQDVTVTY